MLQAGFSTIVVRALAAKFNAPAKGPTHHEHYYLAPRHIQYLVA